MKKIFLLIIILLIVSCAKEKTENVAPGDTPTILEEVENTKVTRIQIIDGYDAFYTKTGFLKINRSFLFFGWIRIKEISDKGNFTSWVKPGQYASVTIDEYPSIYEVPALPERHSERWPSAEDVE